MPSEPVAASAHRCPTCEQKLDEVVVRITGVCPTHGVVPVVCGDPECWCASEHGSDTKQSGVRPDRRPTYLHEQMLADLALVVEIPLYAIPDDAPFTLKQQLAFQRLTDALARFIDDMPVGHPEHPENPENRAAAGAESERAELEQLRDALRKAQRYPESLTLLSGVATQMARDLAILAAGGHGTSEGLRKYVELGVVEVER